MIIPFRGYRYSNKAGSLKDLIAPPYDVIDDLYKRKLKKKSQYNIVHLTLPETPDYEYVREKLDMWCRQKILVQDENEKFYIIKQRFCFKGTTFERYGFIGLFDLEKSDKIIRHEIIFNKYRDDRIRLLQTTKSNLEPIFLLCEDRDNVLEKASESINFNEKFDFEDYSIEFSLCNPEILSELIGKIADGNLFIADGHHRFQASFEFFKQNPDAPRYIMVYLTNLFSDGLLVLPTHRAVKNIDVESNLSRIREFFTIQEKQNLEEILAAIEENREKISFGVYFRGRFQTWSVRNPEAIIKSIPENRSDQWKSLDVAILHYFLFEKYFNIPAGEKLYYDRDPYFIVNYVDKNPESAGFFMQTPDLMKIRKISQNGEILPPKTTFFYPKVPSGLVIAKYV